MRRENLPDWAHDKVTWKRSRGFLTRHRNNIPLRRSLLSASFGTYRRRSRDVLMGSQGYVPLRRCWVFHLRLDWDVKETHWWDVVVTFSWDVDTTFQWDVVETYHWDVLATFHGDLVGCFIWDVTATSLGRTGRRRYVVAAMSCCWVGYC